MTTLHHADASRTDFASTLADRLSRMVERVRKGLRNRRTVTRLDTLDDHVLADIGLTRADVREANLDPEFDAQALIQADRRRKKEAHRQERAARRGGEEA